MGRARRSQVSSLIIVERAFRGTVESQYSHAPWMSEMVKAMGGNTSLVLKSHCVLYALNKQQDVSIDFGNYKINTLANYNKAISSVLARGIPVYAKLDDCLSRGIAINDLINGVKAINTLALAKLIDDHDKAWFW